MAELTSCNGLQSGGTGPTRKRGVTGENVSPESRNLTRWFCLEHRRQECAKTTQKSNINTAQTGWGKGHDARGLKGNIPSLKQVVVTWVLTLYATYDSQNFYCEVVCSEFSPPQSVPPRCSQLGGQGGNVPKQTQNGPEAIPPQEGRKGLVEELSLQLNGKTEATEALKGVRSLSAEGRNGGDSSKKFKASGAQAGVAPVEKKGKAGCEEARARTGGAGARGGALRCREASAGHSQLVAIQKSP